MTTLEHRLDMRGSVLPDTPDRDEGPAEIAADNQLDLGREGVITDVTTS